MNAKGLFAAVFALAGLGANAGATVYQNSPNTDDITYFGQGHTTTYGQVFVSPGGMLKSWVFLDTDPKTDGARLVVARWNGFDPVGPALFDSLSQILFSDGISTGPLFTRLYYHFYNDINISLTAGQQYVAYITVAGVANPANISMVAGSTSSPLGGGFRFLNSGGADPLSPAYVSQHWDFLPPFPDLYYRAEFGPDAPPPPAVPEPSAWTMMLLGFGGLGVALRTRRRSLLQVA